MSDHILHRRKKKFCRYCLQAFSTKEILKPRINDCFKINGKQMIQVAKKGEYVKIKNYERKIKSPFIIYADFKSILVPVMKGKIQINLIQANIKNISHAVIAKN